MKKSLTIILSIFALTQIIGCIEVRDKNSDDPVLKSANVSSDEVAEQDMTIDEPVYYVGGKFLHEKEFQYAQTDKNNPLWKVQASWNKKISKLTLGKNAVIYTMGANVHLEVDNLISDGAQITTFPIGSTAVEGQVGKSGGHIYLEVNKAEGFLSIVMRGQNGGKGFKGDNPDNSKNGVCDSKNISDPATKYKLASMIVKTPTAGATGNKGHDGFRGGDSGTFALVVLDRNSYDLFKTNLYKDAIPGLGGVGGDGGDGGKQGVCPGIPLDSKLDGGTGPQGDHGPDGSVEKSCFVSVYDERAVADCK